ncbi:hypothetical protein J7E37_21095 [Bacillus sp. ISL-39]|nr:hypothetical protein [Bacillus sp. ISL-39]
MNFQSCDSERINAFFVEFLIELKKQKSETTNMGEKISMFLKWFLLIIGLAVIVGTLILGISTEQSVPAGVDLGLEIYYFIAVLIGGLFIYLSTRFSGIQNK